jgi:nucleotide-binding universal stress UspA family protein
MKIMVGYDGTEVAKEALRAAKKHAKTFGASVYVLTSMIGGEEDHAEQIQQAEAGLAYAVEVFESDGIPCEEHLLIRGLEPGEDLVQFAEENEVDEIVIGIKRRSKVGKFLFGSTAQYVILEAPCPVLTVK